MFVSFTFAKIHIIFETTKQNCNYYKVILRTGFEKYINTAVRRFNICIPDAQYSSFSALRNHWCEIREF